MKIKGLFICLITLMMLVLNGCSLAKVEAGDNDQCIGVFITMDYLGNIETEDGKIYATIEDIDDFDIHFSELQFEGIEGFPFLIVQVNGEELSIIDKENLHETTVNQHYDRSFAKIKTMIYGLFSENTEEKIFYFNKIYQTDTGQIYLMPGAGSVYKEPGIGGGKIFGTNNWELTIHATMFASEPTEIQLYHMNANHQLIKTEKYTPGDLPEQLTLTKETEYIIVETVWTDGEVTVELPDLQEGTFSTVYRNGEHILSRQLTEITWENQ